MPWRADSAATKSDPGVFEKSPPVPLRGPIAQGGTPDGPSARNFAFTSDVGGERSTKRTKMA